MLSLSTSQARFRPEIPGSLGATPLAPMAVWAPVTRLGCLASLAPLAAFTPGGQLVSPRLLGSGVFSAAVILQLLAMALVTWVSWLGPLEFLWPSHLGKPRAPLHWCSPTCCRGAHQAPR